MRRVILLVMIFVLSSCTIGQRQAEPTQSSITNLPAPGNTPTAMPTIPAPVVTVTNTSFPPPTGPRRPRGLYAEHLTALDIAAQEKKKPSITPAELHAYFRNLYNGILANPAVSGLAIGITWALLNPNPQSSSQPYDWGFMDDAFESVAAWNSANPAQPPKTVQLQISAGFGTPKWVLEQIPSCDGLFQSPPQKPPSDCGKATFLGFAEGGGGVLPLPWNAFYKKSFRTFLTAFADRYGSNPAFVSIEISGPSAASTEIMLPTDTRTPPQAQFGGITANDMWLKLLAFAYPDKPAYQKSDQAFIDEWEAATDMYGQIFSNVTLVADTGAGLPIFGNIGFTVPPAFKDDCATPPDMDCAAEMTILSHFVDSSVAPNDAKATQESGLNGIRAAIARGVKRRAQVTMQLTSPSAQILGGLQLSTSAARAPLEEGCASQFPPDKYKNTPDFNLGALPVADIPQACLAPGISVSSLSGFGQYRNVPPEDLISPEQALYNVLVNYFDGTPAAASFGGTVGEAPMNYLQIYTDDFQYATMHSGASVKVIRSDGALVSVSAQDLLNLASRKLLDISEPRRSP